MKSNAYIHSLLLAAAVVALVAEPATAIEEKGIHPTQDGWQNFTVAPRLGDLKWACATVPTPQGNIEVEVEGGRIKLSVPAGTTALYDGKTYAGPVEMQEELKHK